MRANIGVRDHVHDAIDFSCSDGINLANGSAGDRSAGKPDEQFIDAAGQVVDERRNSSDMANRRIMRNRGADRRTSRRDASPFQIVC